MAAHQYLEGGGKRADGQGLLWLSDELESVVIIGLLTGIVYMNRSLFLGV